MKFCCNAAGAVGPHRVVSDTLALQQHRWALPQKQYTASKTKIFTICSFPETKKEVCWCWHHGRAGNRGCGSRNWTQAKPPPCLGWALFATAARVSTTLLSYFHFLFSYGLHCVHGMHCVLGMHCVHGMHCVLWMHCVLGIYCIVLCAWDALCACITSLKLSH